MALGRFSAASSLPLADQSLETVSGVKSRATNTLQVLSLTFVQLHALPLFLLCFSTLLLCRCNVVAFGSTGQLGAVAMDCDRVVFHGEAPQLPYGAPIVYYSQRHSGQQVLPSQVNDLNSATTFE